MFATESSVKQLRPEKILSLVSGVEEVQWRRIKLLESEEDLAGGLDSAEPGLAILRHGSAVKKIHGYFSHLESRRCCMLLTGRKSTFGSVRVVHRNDTTEVDPELPPGPKQQHQGREPAMMLDGKEFQCFRHAFLCASYPVLGAPNPPSPQSPSPTSMHPSSIDGCPSEDFRGEASPSWLDDSGVEVSDDVAMIPTETLCDLLQRAFRLNQDKYRHYQQAIAAKYRKKTPQKVLAEELVGQLATLENNNHPFYNPHSFLSQHGYGHWQQGHRNQISRLLSKFWHSSLPMPCDLQGTFHDLDTVHDDYALLLQKLLLFEDRFRAMEREGSSALIKPLSSASLRLLKEFSLRYGIGEVYVQVVYLEQLASHFVPTMGLVVHTTAVVSGLARLLSGSGGSGRGHIMVRKELSLITAVLSSLQQQTTKALTQMKSLFPSNQPAQAVGSMIGLTEAVLHLQWQLGLEERQTLSSYLQSVVQKTFRPDYERHKTVAKSELAEKRESGITPRLLNVMIGIIRDEVLEYKTNFQSTFKQYFDITTLAAQTFYSLLMADVEILCQVFSQNMSLDINLLMVGLAHRLHQLDHDWAPYVPQEAQAWRQSFLPEVLQWCAALKIHLQDFVLEAVAGDRFSTKSVHLEDATLSVSSSTLTQRTTPSLSPSATSAFSSIHASVASPPAQETIPEEMVISETEDSAYLVPGAWSMETTSRPRPKTTFEGRPQQPRSSCLTFSTLRHSNSLPDIAAAVAEEKRLDIQMMEMGGGASSDSNEMETAFGQASDGTTSSDSSEAEVKKDYKYPPVEVVSRIQPVTFPENRKLEKQDSATSESTASSSGIMPSQPPFITSSTGNSSSTSQPIPFMSGRPQDSGPQEKQQSAPDRTNKTPTGAAMGRTSEGSWGSEKFPVFSHDFEDSLGSVWSNLSLSMPRSGQDAELPVSGSLVDMLVLLRRLTAFATTLLDTIFPDLHDGNLPDTPLSASLPSAAFPHLHGFGLMTGTDDLLADSLPGYREPSPTYLKAKWDIVKRMRKCLHASLALYADNMLSLDLCGTAHLTASKLVGIKLVDHLVTQRESGLLWGCRHELERLGDCQHYSRQKAALLCDRYEPISHKMCIRINNVMAAMDLLETFEVRLEAAAGRHQASIYLPQSPPRNFVSPSVNSLQDFSVIDGDELEDFWSHPGPFEDSANRCLSTSSLSELPSQEALRPIHAHLLSVFRGLIRLMSYRLNLFIRDALSLLLSLNRAGVTIETCLFPLTNFLRNYLDVLSTWLYKRAFQTFLECLWINIVQDFDVETDLLLEDGKNSDSRAHRLLQAFMHLLKFMNNFGKGVTKTVMLAQAEGVIFRLQLYTLSIPQILAVHSQLCDYTYERRRYWEPDSCLSHILTKLQHDLLAMRKCFSGSDLINWILRNKSLFCDLDPALTEENAPITREMAAKIAQVLLDKKLLGNVEKDAYGGRSHSGSLLSLPDPGYHYPELTPVASQSLPQGLYHASEFASESSDSDPTPSPSPLPSVPRPPPTPHVPPSEQSTMSKTAILTPASLQSDALSETDCSTPTLGEQGVTSEVPGHPPSSAPSSSTPAGGLGTPELPPVDCVADSDEQGISSNHASAAENGSGAADLPILNSELEKHSSEQLPRQQLQVGDSSLHSGSLTQPSGLVGEGENELADQSASASLRNGLLGGSVNGSESSDKATPESCNATPTNVIHSDQVDEEQEKNCRPKSEGFPSDGADEATEDKNTHQVGAELKDSLDESNSSNASNVSAAAAVLPKLGVAAFNPQPSPQGKKMSSTDPAKFSLLRSSSVPSPATPSQSGHYVSFPSAASASLASTPIAGISRSHLPHPASPLSNYTPVSFMSSFSAFSAFMDSTEEFYYVLPTAVETPSRTSGTRPSPSEQESLLDLSQMNVERLKKSPETLSMAMQCFQQKISPLHLISIVYQRRQSSPVARRVVRRMPASLQEQIKYHLNLPVSGCVHS